MALHITGRNIITQLLLGETVTPLLATTGAVLWVASGTCEHDSSDNGLNNQTAATSAPATMEAGYPIRLVNQMTFRGIWGTDCANFNWWEWGVQNATTSVTTTAGDKFMLQRKVEDLGTKTSAQQWQLTVDITVTT